VIKLARRKTLDILASIFLTQLFVPLSLAEETGGVFHQEAGAPAQPPGYLYVVTAFLNFKEYDPTALRVDFTTKLRAALSGQGGAEVQSGSKSFGDPTNCGDRTECDQVTVEEVGPNKTYILYAYPNPGLPPEQLHGQQIYQWPCQFDTLTDCRLYLVGKVVPKLVSHNTVHRPR